MLLRRQNAMVCRRKSFWNAFFSFINSYIPPIDRKRVKNLCKKQIENPFFLSQKFTTFATEIKKYIWIILLRIRYLKR
jgi:hypothetical protein